MSVLFFLDEFSRLELEGQPQLTFAGVQNKKPKVSNFIYGWAKVQLLSMFWHHLQFRMRGVEDREWSTNESESIR